MKTSELDRSLQRESPRYMEILAGVVCAGLAVAFLALWIGTMNEMLSGSDNTEVLSKVAFLIGSWCIATMLFVFARRLITGRGRESDGGLMPPGTLRLGAVIFSVGGLLLMFVGARGVVRGVEAILMAAACLGLARHRRRTINTDGKSRDVA